MALNVVTDHSRSHQNSDPFSSLGISQLLEADSRATFALHADSDWLSTGKLRPVLVNPALRKQDPLIDHLFNVDFNSCTELRTFACWIHEPAQSSHPTCRYANIEWHRTVVADAWLVIGATHTVKAVDFDNHVCSVAPSLQQPPVESYDWTQTIIPVQCSEYVHQLRSRDWASTAVGSMSTWPEELRIHFNSMMRTTVGQAMYWGSDMTVIYNQAFIPIVGTKHPRILGQKASEAWSEDWQTYGQIFKTSYNSAIAIETKQAMMLHRSGFLEEVHFDYSILPLVGSNGVVHGIHTTVTEITESILAERRLKTTTNVREYTAGCSTIDEIYQHFLSALETSKQDIAFAVIYARSIDREDTALTESAERLSQEIYLKGFVGLSDNTLPLVIPTTSASDPFGLLFEMASHLENYAVLSKSEEVLSGIPNDSVLPEYGHSAGYEKAVLYPLRASGANEPFGFLLIGLNCRRPYDRVYQQFTTNLHAQLGEAVDSNITHLRMLRQQQKQADLERFRLQAELAKQAREAKAMEQRFTRLTDMSPVAINIARLDGTITYANNTWHRLFGDGPESYEPMSWLSKFHEEDLEKTSHLWATLPDEDKIMDYEFRIKTPWVEVICTSVDITHHKWIAQESQKRTAEAIDAKKQQDAFTDMVTHEMRNPLNAIIQCADIIQSSLSDEADSTVEHELIRDVIDNARTITYCAMHQKHIIDDLLTLSKLDSDLLSFTPVRSNPVKIMKQVIGMFEAEAEASAITLTSHVDSSIPKLRADDAMMDPQRVSQVLINLVTNAVKFTRDRPQRSIKVSLSVATDRPSLKDNGGFKYFPSSRRRPNVEPSGNKLFFTFSVTDTGPGIPADAESRLFKRFSQTSLKSHVVYGGSGLGLWISRELTEMQGGEIGFRTYPEGGTTFAFYVCASFTPATIPNSSRSPSIAGRDGSVKSTKEISTIQRPSDKPTSSVVSRVKKDVDLKTINVLLTEDNLINQKVMKKQLEKIFKRVFIANNGQEALELMAKTKIAASTATANFINEEVDLILMDIEMPVLNGVDSTKAIRELEAQGQLDRRIPIIAVSANARAEQIAQYREAGMNDVLSKPFVMRDLIAMVARIL